MNLSRFPYHFTFLRHGESIGNAAGYHQGQADFELNETGRAQVHALVERWQAQRVEFDLILSSPLARARETAEILSTALKLPVEYEAHWMERNNGKFAGLHPEEAARQYPIPEFTGLFDPIGVTGESQWELYLRAGRAVQDLLKRPPGHYLVISHGGLFNMVMYVILGIPPQANFHGVRFLFQNTSFAVVHYNPGRHSWLVERLNDREHWRQGE